MLTVPVRSLLKPGGLCTVSVYLPAERPAGWMAQLAGSAFRTGLAGSPHHITEHSNSQLRTPILREGEPHLAPFEDLIARSRRRFCKKTALSGRHCLPVGTLSVGSSGHLPTLQSTVTRGAGCRSTCARAHNTGCIERIVGGQAFSSYACYRTRVRRVAFLTPYAF